MSDTEILEGNVVISKFMGGYMRDMDHGDRTNYMTPSQLTVKERILCAAIWYSGKEDLVHGPYGTSTGVVMCGFRHFQIIELYHALTGKKTRVQGTCQGFLTSDNRFVSREMAAEIAFKAGQTKENKHKLFSEDLY